MTLQPAQNHQVNTPGDPRKHRPTVALKLYRSTLENYSPPVVSVVARHRCTTAQPVSNPARIGRKRPAKPTRVLRAAPASCIERSSPPGIEHMSLVAKSSFPLREQVSLVKSSTAYSRRLCDWPDRSLGGARVSARMLSRRLCGGWTEAVSKLRDSENGRFKKPTWPSGLLAAAELLSVQHDCRRRRLSFELTLLPRVRWHSENTVVADIPVTSPCDAVRSWSAINCPGIQAK